MAPETRYNIALLEQVRDTIADESQHDQTLWGRISRVALRAFPGRWTDRFGNQFIEVTCPTAACVAGWASTIAGAKMLVSTDEAQHSTGEVQCNFVLTPDGEEYGISNYAREQLGLTYEEADALFAAEWDNEQVLENLDAIIHAARHGMEWEKRWVQEYEDDDEDGGY